MTTLSRHRRTTPVTARFWIRAAWNRLVFRACRTALNRLTAISPAGRRYDLDHVRAELDSLIDYWSIEK